MKISLISLLIKSPLEGLFQDRSGPYTERVAIRKTMIGRARVTMHGQTEEGQTFYHCSTILVGR
ncbi:MAG: hypothetical protein NTY13_01460 [Chlamydiae bacterium]|nr:hypothetical protein [Chlamydiota bacterium]